MNFLLELAVLSILALTFASNSTFEVKKKNHRKIISEDIS